MTRVFAAIAATPDEVAAVQAGDGIVASPDVVMNRACTLDAPLDQVWPWLVQLGKHRAGWYLPHTVERFIPASRRALRTIDPRWQTLAVGDVIPDYGGRDETLTVAEIDPPCALVYRSVRGQAEVTWSLALSPAPRDPGTRLHLRLTLGPLRRKWLATSVGDLVDAATVAGMAAGLNERIRETGR